MARRHRWAFCAALAIASLLVGGSGAYATLDGLVRRASAEGVQDPLALLGLRSPGGRVGKGLLQSKPDHRTKAGLRERPGDGLGEAGAPSERVLALVRERPPEAVEPAAPVGFTPQAPTGFVLPSAPGGGIAPGPFGTGGPLVGPLGLNGPPSLLPGAPCMCAAPDGPFTDTPPLDGPPTGVPPDGPPIDGIGPSAVPEPAAWSMMILGVFAVGALLRRDRAAGRRLRRAHG